MSSFSNWSEADVARHNAKACKENKIPVSEHPPDAGPEGSEAELHDLILQACRRNGWIALHGAMSERTHRTIGECDFCCLLPNGVVIFIECKTPQGKLSVPQTKMESWMAGLGHKMHVVRRFSDFEQLIKRCLESGLGGSQSFASVEPSSGKLL